MGETGSGPEEALAAVAYSVALEGAAVAQAVGPASVLVMGG